jgi:hypothetical protein
VIDSNVEYEKIGSDVAGLGLDGIFGQTESRICMAYQVPPILIASWLGLSRSTYSNYEQARRSFYTETLRPKWRKFESALTRGLAAEFGSDIAIKFDMTNIEALQEDRNRVWGRALSGWNGQMIKRSEARQMVGFPVDEVEDGIYKPTASVAPAVEAPLSAVARKREQHAAAPHFDSIRAKSEEKIKATVQRLFRAQAARTIRHIAGNITE